MKLYLTKYPIICGYKDSKPIILPEGTVLRIVCINGDGFDMKPLRKVMENEYIFVSANVFEIALIETEYVEDNGGGE